MGVPLPFSLFIHLFHNSMSIYFFVYFSFGNAYSPAFSWEGETEDNYLGILGSGYPKLALFRIYSCHLPMRSPLLQSQESWKHFTDSFAGRVLNIIYISPICCTFCQISLLESFTSTGSCFIVCLSCFVLVSWLFLCFLVSMVRGDLGLSIAWWEDIPLACHSFYTCP